jgi:hypothetical protein
MPALERAANNTTLALHYAAARGCLDCVRLLVDSTPDLRYVALPEFSVTGPSRSECSSYGRGIFAVLYELKLIDPRRATASRPVGMRENQP